MQKESYPYSKFSLVKEMWDTSAVIRDFDEDGARLLSLSSDRILLTGEGSSRIFPAKRSAALARSRGYRQSVVVEGALQAAEYQLSGYHLFVASNSGKTAEGVQLLRHLREEESSGGKNGKSPEAIAAIVGREQTPIAELADRYYLLRCGKEDAVAASKSVVEQALVYETLFRSAHGDEAVDLDSLSEAFLEALSTAIDSEITRTLSSSPTIYFAGRNDGVAEELTLKTNEITRLKSDYLEGTYAVHGIEEVMQPNEAVVVVDPFEEEEEKFREVLEEGVGMSVIAISSRQTSFPTIRIPELGEMNPYLLLAAGWNLLIETGIELGINIDKPLRARKVGNEYSSGQEL